MLLNILTIWSTSSIYFSKNSLLSLVSRNNLNQYHVSFASFLAMVIPYINSFLEEPDSASNALAPIDVADRITCLTNIRLLSVRANARVKWITPSEKRYIRSWIFSAVSARLRLSFSIYNLAFSCSFFHHFPFLGPFLALLVFLLLLLLTFCFNPFSLSRIGCRLFLLVLVHGLA